MRICGGTACGAPAGAPHFWQKLVPGGRPAPQPVQNPIRQPSILPGKETVNDDTWAPVQLIYA